MSILFKNIGWQNVRSYGSTWHQIDFDLNEGEIILLAGEIGAGKTSISDALDFNLFGKCKGNEGGTAKISSIVNYYNGNLLTTSALKIYNKDLEISRGLSPNIFEFEYGGEADDRAGKLNRQAKLEAILNMDFSTFRNFVNVTMADFKDFMELKAQEKRDLLDKLFNLSQINELHQITKDLLKETQANVNIINSSIKDTQTTIEKISKSLDEYKNRSNIANEKLQLELNAQISVLKDEYTQAQEKLKNVEEELEQIQNNGEEYLEEGRKLKIKLEQIQEKLSLYEQGKCPTCAQPFNEDHATHKNKILKDEEEYIQKISKIKENVSILKEKKLQLNAKKNNYIDIISNINNTARELQGQLKMILPAESLDISEFENTLIDLQQKEQELNEKRNAEIQNQALWNQLSKILSSDGIKKELIAKLIPQLNWWIKIYLEELQSKYQIQFDEMFEAKITFLGKEVEVDNMSRGQHRITNLATLLSCLTIMQLQRPINLMFFDEIFSSIDISTTRQIIKVLRNFAKKHKIHIFVVHHAQLELDIFDRVFSVNLDVYTSLTQIK